MLQIKTTANKGDVFMVGLFFGGWGTKKLEIFGWNSTKNEDGFMNFITWSEQTMRTVLQFLKYLSNYQMQIPC